MKLTIFLASFALCGGLFAGQYVGVSIGTNNATMTDNSNKGLKIGAHAQAKYGYAFGSGIRSEAEISYRTGKYKTIYNMIDKETVGSREYNSIHSWSYMGNVLYDISNLNVYSVVPYIGIGVGYCQNTQESKIKFDDSSKKDKLKDNRFAYQGIIGAKYAINETLSTGVEYHYFCGRSHQKDHSVGVNLVKNF